MPSLKSRLVAFVLRHSRKKAFSSPDELHAWIKWARPRQNHRPPARLLRRLDIRPATVGGYPFYEVEPRTGAGDMHILYLHGGAYCFEITQFHWNLIAEMAERLGARVSVPIYPLAPEHDIHDIFAVGMAAYRHVAEATRSGDFVLMGDSAGGNMAVVLTMMAAQEGLPLASRMALISPGLDVTLENPEVFEVERLDPWLGIPGGLEAIRIYAADLDRADWRVSPIKGDLSVLPRTLILAGQYDILTPDTTRFAALAVEAGAEVELVVEPGMFHVWPLIDMPEARRARDRIVAFLSEPEPAAAQARRAKAQNLPDSLNASIVARM
jgi:acetyl esterase/lipase